MIDNSVIGYDASGQDNHFTPFNLTATAADLPQYNKTATWSSLVSWASTQNGYSNTEYFWNGNPNQPAVGPGANSGRITLNFYGSATAEAYIDLWVNTNVFNVGTNGGVKFNGSGQYVDGTVISKVPGTVVHQVRYPFSGTLNTISWEGYSGTPACAMMAIDGKILTDPNIIPPADPTLDGVKDTPMRNYAVLEGNAALTNGNLDVACANSGEYGASTISMSTGRYYFEVVALGGNVIAGTAPAGTDPTGTGAFYYPDAAAGTVFGVTYNAETGTTQIYLDGTFYATKSGVVGSQVFAVSAKSGNTADATVNFGQQPFVASNVTHDLDAGTVDIGGETYKTLYQKWSEWVVETLRSDIAEADALRSVLISHAMTYDAATDYCEGSVIKAFGQLWIAVNDAPATSYADIDALRSHVNWEQLNISA